MAAPRRLFAIPRSIAGPYVQALCAAGLVGKPAVARAGHYRIPVLTFPKSEDDEGASRIAGILREHSDDLRCLDGFAKVGSYNVTMVVGAAGRMTMEAPEGSVQDWRESSTARAIESELEDISMFGGGLRIVYHAEDRQHKPPLPDVPGTIHVFPWCSPPGAVGHIFIPKVFEFYIDVERQSILTFEPTLGRGESLGDGAHSLVQLLGNNWYLLPSVASYYNEFTSHEIFRRLMALAFNRWAQLQCGARPVRQPAPTTRKMFISAASKWVGTASQFTAKQLAKLDQKISNLSKELALAERERADWLRVADTLKGNRHTVDLIQSLPSQWRRIRSHPRVDRVELVDEAIHVTTKPVVIEYRGRRYPMGQFTIRIGMSGILSIWNLERIHPGGVPHPHVNEHRHPCFGNATTAVKEAAAEHRYADVIAQVITWLFDGYQHDLALHKITEWPYESTRPDGRKVLSVSLEGYLQ
jgi:hypothetical protein